MPEQPASNKSFESALKTLSEVEATLREVEDLLYQVRNGAFHRLLKLAFRKKDHDELFAKLSRHKETLSIAVTMVTT
jgi:hypothetical protein